MGDIGPSPIYMAILEPKTMVKVFEALRELGIEPKGIYRERTKIFGVVLVDEGGLRYLREAGIEVVGEILEVKEDDNPLCVALRAALASQGVRDPNPLIVGIDLGESIGVALIAGRVMLFAKSVKSYVKALDLVCSALACLDSSRKIVRVGIPRKECPEYEKLVEALAKALDPSVELELVPEARSSKLSSYIDSLGRMNKDARAALNIALARLESL